MGLVQRLVKDPAPRVRLRAVRLLSFVPTRESAETALEVLRQPTDYYLQYVLDSTMTTLEKVWKPVLTSGKPFSADNPEGLAFLLARLEPAELSAAPAGIPVYRAMLERPGIEPRIRQQALEGLSKLNGSQPLQELIAALDRSTENRPAVNRQRIWRRCSWPWIPKRCRARAGTSSGSRFAVAMTRRDKVDLPRSCERMAPPSEPGIWPPLRHRAASI